MQFRVLGQLEVVGDEGPLALGGPKQRAVLAHLILRPNRLVPAGLLIDELWGDEPPETARNTLQTYIYRLRKVVGDARIEAGSGGYLLHAEPDEIDAVRFEALFKEAKGNLTADPVAALVALDQGLALWRGDALAGLDEPSLSGEIARLEELRLGAIEYRISAELHMGRHSTVVSDLEALTVRYPLRERLWAHLMIALYRAGRQGEALDAYRRAREVLADQLGADPSTELQHLHQQILNHDPELRAPLEPAQTPTVPPSSGDLEPGAEFAGYRIDRIIGRGGMGVVYLAEHEGLRRKVALKLLAPPLAEDRRFRERFVRESRLAASIDHPNVIPIYEAGEADGRLYIAMRFVDGTDLRTLLREQGTLDAAQAARIVSQVAAALDAAHDQGLVHRDVKPANVLIARQRATQASTHAYLTDFGLTKRAASDSGVTGTGQFVGTLGYAAPEQFRGEVADTRTDVYSLGCMLFECLAGHPPFQAENEAAVMFGHLMEAPPRLSVERPDLSKNVDEVVAAAMAKAPEDRYQSAGAFASRLSTALGHPVNEPSTGTQPPGLEGGSDEGPIQTFLIADVRGYTHFSQEHGDEAAGRLAARFAEVTSQVIEAGGGAVLELRGDEALCIFSTTRRAIRSAIELQARYLAETNTDPTLPLSVGVGIDTGEAVPVAGGFRGRALNLAARLCGSARAGEILATREALHMAGRMDGIHVEDRGLASFKGFSEPVGVVRVAAEGEDPARWFADHTPSRPRETGRVSRRRRRAIGAVAGALVVALIAVLLQVVGGAPARASFSPGIAIVDQQTGAPLASVPTSAIRQPAEVIHADGTFWVHNLDPNSFVEIDPRDGRVLTQIPAPFHDVGSFAVDGDTLWVTGPSVVKIDIGIRQEVDRFEFPDPTHGVVVAEGSVWVTMPSEDATLRLDPVTGEVEHRFTDLPGSLALAYGDGSVWSAGWSAPFGGFTGGGGVNRIDPDTNVITKTELTLPTECCPAAAGGGFGWTADPTKGVIYKIDQTGSVVATRTTGPGAAIGSFDDGIVWVGNSDVGTVSGVDSLTGARRTFRFEHPIQGVAAGSGVLIVTLGPGKTYEDVIDGLQGKVARLFTPSGFLGTPDPAMLFGSFGYWVESATCAKLLTYPDAPAPEGWSLRPEVAASLPEVSSDGRTYTFTIRSGYRFSPPSNETVTAETFRNAIERALSPELHGPGRFYIWDIEGQRAFRRGEADHISGLRAEGDTLAIELVEPSSDFLGRLSVPFFCPVPTDTPYVPGGAGAYAGYPHRVALAVPSAGPYYIADHLDGEYAILKRNPNYTGPRPNAFDAIALREGVDPGIAVGLVERGAWDGITHIADPLLTPAGPVAQKYGAEDDPIEAPRYFAAPTPVTGFFIFNASRPPFSDPDVRRAAALAIDREALAEIWGNVPTDQFLPPVMPGSEDLELYPLDGSGLDEARSLMGGRTVTAVIGIPGGSDYFHREAELMRSSLAQIGITLEIEEFPELAYGWPEPDAELDIYGLGIEQTYADPAVFLWDMLRFRVAPWWLPDGVAEQVEGLFDLTGAEQQAAAAALADRLATDEVPLAADLHGAIPTFLSPSLGCRVFPPFGFGVDLAALCPDPSSS